MLKNRNKTNALKIKKNKKYITKTKPNPNCDLTFLYFILK